MVAGISLVKLKLADMGDWLVDLLLNAGWSKLVLLSVHIVAVLGS